jgi:hypothetical protein
VTLLGLDEGYVAEHEDVVDGLISIPDAVAAGTTVFGEALVR